MEKLILFDVDGTLIGGKHYHAQAFSDAFSEVFDIDAAPNWNAVQGMTEQQVIKSVLRPLKFSDRIIEKNLEFIMDEMVTSFSKTIKATVS